LISPDQFQVDLLPFGEIEAAGQVIVERTGMSSIKADGMKEVYAFGAELIHLDTGHTFKAATLPGIVLLKLVAYDDREELRQKDALDIGKF
jgi:predicted nucleotidyltransferase